MVVIHGPTEKYRGSGRVSLPINADIFDQPLPRWLDDYYVAGLLCDVDLLTNPISNDVVDIGDFSSNAVHLTYDDFMLQIFPLFRSLFDNENMILIEEDCIPSSEGWHGRNLYPGLLNVGGQVYADDNLIHQKIREVLSEKKRLPSKEYRAAVLVNTKLVVGHHSQFPSFVSSYDLNSDIFTVDNFRLFFQAGIVESESDIGKVTDELILAKPFDTIIMPDKYFVGQQKKEFVNVHNHSIVSIGDGFGELLDLEFSKFFK
ncbi:hypothetical protein HOK51_05390 [Candidatus Woesearchaeota archaeon]|jgi:hypothetical protein|nr:hypothetical protein [Candidatus Woesearchaeota archaeon]MBT6519261.1 hypothetical protein [Candidatus Woesearchaeota archaeon]MBT7368453.1 hypothetical protein [Candidatus Woesearchaeota archaeon]